MKSIPTFEEYEIKTVQTLPGSKVVISDKDELEGWYNLPYSEANPPNESEQVFVPSGHYEVDSLDTDTIALFPVGNKECSYMVKRGDYEKLKMKIQL
jgi:hypothetical protein